MVVTTTVIDWVVDARRRVIEVPTVELEAVERKADDGRMHISLGVVSARVEAAFTKWVTMVVICARGTREISNGVQQGEYNMQAHVGIRRII